MSIIQFLPSIFSGVGSFISGFSEICAPCLAFNDNMEILKENLQVLKSRLCDIDTELKKEEESGKQKMSEEVENWLERVCHIEIEFDQLQDQFCKRLCRGSDVKKLKERVASLIQQSNSFRVLVRDGSETNRKRLFTTQLHGEKLNQELGKIKEWLKIKTDRVAILGIHGMGGVGKSTLANHIYDHICSDLQGTRDKFHVLWVTVSQDAGINKLQNDLAKKLEFDFLKEKYHDEDEKAAILKNRLSEKKNVVLILDDVWKFLDLSKIGILAGSKECKVIITTRKLNVCSEMGCKDQDIISVQPLSDEEAWGLFLNKLDCGDMLSPEVEDVAKQMAKKCDGLPLAIITVARSMTGLYGIHEWRDALEELQLSITNNEDMKDVVLPILRYSYDRLGENSRLKSCFLYCSLYPEDYRIPRNELISNFIREGMMNQRNSRAAEFDQGHAILNKLVNVCLLESESERGKDYLKMHDLVRHMATEITKRNPKFMPKAGLQLAQLPDEQEWGEDLDKVSFMVNKITEIPDGLSPKCPQLLMLTLSKNPLKLISNSFFIHMCGLQVLNLSSTDIERLPDSISELQNLNALLLGECTNLRNVPSLKKLKKLKDFDISSTDIKELPEGMECLGGLKYLNMREIESLVEIPRGLLPRLNRLQHLYIPSHIKVEAQEFKSLKLLESFEGTVEDNIFNFNCLNKSPPFSWYKIAIGDENTYPHFHYPFTRNIDYSMKLQNLSFGERRGLALPYKTQRLEIEECKGLSDCFLDSVPCLKNCKDLKVCVISKCDEIETIVRISAGNESMQKLLELRMEDLPNLIGLIKREPGAALLPSRGTFFSSLSTLRIEGCHKIKKLFSHKSLVLNLPNLETLHVIDCNQMEEIIGDEEEENEGVSSTSTSSNNPTNDFAFSKLTLIHLQDLPELKNIYKRTLNGCDSITVKKCRQLRRLPLLLPLKDGQPSPPPSLQNITVEREWWESLEWDHPNSKNVLQSFVCFYMVGRVMKKGGSLLLTSTRKN